MVLVAGQNMNKCWILKQKVCLTFTDSAHCPWYIVYVCAGPSCRTVVVDEVQRRQRASGLVGGQLKTCRGGRVVTIKHLMARLFCTWKGPSNM